MSIDNINHSSIDREWGHPLDQETEPSSVDPVFDDSTVENRYSEKIEVNFANMFEGVADGETIEACYISPKINSDGHLPREAIGRVMNWQETKKYLDQTMTFRLTREQVFLCEKPASDFASNITAWTASKIIYGTSYRFWDSPAACYIPRNPQNSIVTNYSYPETVTSDCEHSGESFSEYSFVPAKYIEELAEGEPIIASRYAPSDYSYQKINFPLHLCNKLVPWDQAKEYFNISIIMSWYDDVIPDFVAWTDTAVIAGRHYDFDGSRNSSLARFPRNPESIKSSGVTADPTEESNEPENIESDETDTQMDQGPLSIPVGEYVKYFKK